MGSRGGEKRPKPLGTEAASAAGARPPLGVATGGRRFRSEAPGAGGQRPAWSHPRDVPGRAADPTAPLSLRSEGGREPQRRVSGTPAPAATTPRGATGDWELPSRPQRLDKPRTLSAGPSIPWIQQRLMQARTAFLPEGGAGGAEAGWASDYSLCLLEP